MQALKRRTLFAPHRATDSSDHNNHTPARPWDTLHNLHHLRRSLAWTQAPRQSTASAGLNERLEELLVLELHQNGNRQYFAWNVRTLYKHVLTCITQMPGASGANDNSNSNAPVSRSMSPQKSVMRVNPDTTMNRNTIQPPTLGDALVTPLPLGILPPASKPKKLSQRRRAASTSDRPAATATTTERTSNPTYRERLGGYLHPRDMRRLGTSVFIILFIYVYIVCVIHSLIHSSQ